MTFFLIRRKKSDKKRKKIKIWQQTPQENNNEQTRESERDTERTLRARALLIWNLHTYHFQSIPLRIVHRAIIILSSGGGARSSSHRARAGEEALLPSSIERLVDCGVLEESKNKDGHG